MIQNADIAIVGGGAVGCALALGICKHTNFSVVLIDANSPPDLNKTHHAFDQRTIALSRRSLSIFGELGVDIPEAVTCPIEHIHVSDQGHWGQTRMHADEQGVDKFGQVISLEEIGRVLYQTLHSESSDSLTYLPKSSVTQVVQAENEVTLTLANDELLSARLVVLADGGRSPLAEELGFSRIEKPYAQHALTFNIKTSEPHNGWAYERFTEQGPLALLPMEEQSFGVVFCRHEGRFDQQELATAMGHRFGEIKQISDYQSYPLGLSYLEKPFMHRCLAVGNAAQTLHPIAGQGVNLGFRDIAELVKLLSRTDASALGNYGFLRQYADKRDKDRRNTIMLTDTLVTGFSNQYLPLVKGRNVGLMMMNLLDGAKQGFAEQAMGMKHYA